MNTEKELCTSGEMAQRKVKKSRRYVRFAIAFVSICLIYIYIYDLANLHCCFHVIWCVHVNACENTMQYNCKKATRFIPFTDYLLTLRQQISFD